MVRELSRVFVGKTHGQENIWNDSPKNWNLEELGCWKNPTSTPKDNRALLIKKFNFLHKNINTEKFTDAQRTKILLYTTRSSPMSAVLEFMRIEKLMKDLSSVQNQFSQCQSETLKNEQETVKEQISKCQRALESMNNDTQRQDTKKNNLALHSPSSSRKRKKEDTSDSQNPSTSGVKYRKVLPKPILPKSDDGQSTRTCNDIVVSGLQTEHPDQRVTQEAKKKKLS